MEEQARRIRDALDAIEIDFESWGDPDVTYDAHSVGDALAALDELLASHQQLRAKVQTLEAASAAVEKERDEATAELDRLQRDLDSLFEPRLAAAEAEREALDRKLRALVEIIESVENTRLAGLSPNRREWKEVRDAARRVLVPAAPEEEHLGAEQGSASGGEADGH